MGAALGTQDATCEVTEVPELSHAEACGPSEHAWPLRFVGGALDAPGGWIHAVCTSGPSDG